MRKLRGFIFKEYSSCIEVRLTRECIGECSAQGSNDDAVQSWVKRLRPLLDRLSPEIVKKCLQPVGAWNADDLADHETNLERLVWIAAHQCKEQNSCYTVIE